MESQKKLAICIPTFNRNKFLSINLKLILEQLKNYQLSDRVIIYVSDNGSTDSTTETLSTLRSNKLVFRSNPFNVGLEQNIVDVSSMPTEEYIMYLGDDDYLPEDYISLIFQHIDSQAEVSAIFPLHIAVYPDGREVVTRNSVSSTLNKIFYWFPVFGKLYFATYANQLSGMVLKRKNYLAQYLSTSKVRNIYCFIFFYLVTIFSSRTASVVEVDAFVKITEGNKKDWGYNCCGNLDIIYDNYRYSGLSNKIKFLGFWIFICCHGWRLRIGKNPILALKALVVLNIRSKSPIVFIASMIGFPCAVFIEVRRRLRER